jgi:hypothetical protein
MRTDRRGWVLETAGRLQAGTPARMRQLITTTGHRIRRRMVAVATRMGTALTRRQRTQVRRRVTATGRHTRTHRQTITVVGVHRMGHPRVRIQHRTVAIRRHPAHTLRHRAPIPGRAPVILRRHVRIQRRATQHLHTRTPRPRRVALIPRRAVAMEGAEAGVAVVVEARRRAAALEVVVAAEEAAALAAAGEAPTEEARTVEHFQLHTARPKTGAGFFCV